MKLDTVVMTTGVVFFLLFFTVCTVSAAVHEESPENTYVRADELRDHPGYCFDDNRCALMKEGESWTIDETCESATCYMAHNGTLIEKRTRCEFLSPVLDEDCYIVRVEGKPFPDCCPRLICDNKFKTFFF